MLRRDQSWPHRMRETASGDVMRAQLEATSLQHSTARDICHTEVLPSHRRDQDPRCVSSLGVNVNGIRRRVRSLAEVCMTARPVSIGSFEFVVVTALRTAQLMRGCTPRAATSVKHMVTAQREVAAGTVARVPPDPAIARKHGL